MIKPEGFNVRIFTDWDALNLVLDMPAGDKKETIAVPATALEPCEHIVSYKHEDYGIYHFLFIVPDTRDKRVLIASRNMLDMYNFVHFGTDDTFSNSLRDSVLKLIANYNHETN